MANPLSVLVSPPHFFVYQKINICYIVDIVSNMVRLEKKGLLFFNWRIEVTIYKSPIRHAMSLLISNVCLYLISSD